MTHEAEILAKLDRIEKALSFLAFGEDYVPTSVIDLETRLKIRKMAQETVRDSGKKVKRNAKGVGTDAPTSKA